MTTCLAFLSCRKLVVISSSRLCLRQFSSRFCNAYQIQIYLTQKWDCCDVDERKTRGTQKGLIEKHRKLRVQWGSDYPSTTQMVSHLIVSRWLVNWYLLYALPSLQEWHKAVFRWVRSQGHSQDAFSSPKMRRVPSVFPLKGAPQGPGDEPNPSKGTAP